MQSQFERFSELPQELHLESVQHLPTPDLAHFT